MISLSNQKSDIYEILNVKLTNRAQKFIHYISITKRTQMRRELLEL